MRKKHCASSIFIITVTIAFLLGFFMLTTPQASADNGYKGNDKHKELQKVRDKEYQKHQGEMERESRKHRGEMEREDRKHYEEQGRESGKHREGMERENRKHYKEQSRRGYEKRPDYHKYRGYRERPYDKHRHYVEYDYKGHRYDYHGHWRSWEQWDRYRKKHPHIYEHGRYYHENAHLMFSFCEPGTSNCFFFSIGK